MWWLVSLGLLGGVGKAVATGSVVTNQLILLANGLGTISPDYSNAWLEVGRTYRLTAKPAPGFVFSNWQVIDFAFFDVQYSDNGSPVDETNVISEPLGVFSKQATLVFTMPATTVISDNPEDIISTTSGYQANFADVTPPTVSVANLVNGQRVTSGTYTVKGSAKDNWQVAGVYYQLNGGAWNNTIGTNDWKALLTLVPGTNIFKVFAMDNSGNVSSTNTLVVDDVVISQLQVLVRSGTITPNYSNAWLEVGRNYQVTSVPPATWGFSDWSDGSGNWLTNAPTLQFTMSSNLVLVADTVAYPPVIVTQPQSVQVTNGKPVSLSVTVTGTGPMTYQWFFNANPPPINSYQYQSWLPQSVPVPTNLANAHEATLTFKSGSGLECGYYFVLVTNLYGSAISSFVSVTVIGPPVVIIESPTNQILFPGSELDLSAYANGVGPLSYRWICNGTNLPDYLQNGSFWFSLVDDTPYFSAAGRYQVIVSNAYGSTASSMMNVVVANAVTNLSGWSAVVTDQQNGSFFYLCFGSNTFSQFSPDDNNDSAVGTYSYTAFGVEPDMLSPPPILANLNLEYTLPTTVTNQGMQSILWVFNGPYEAFFGNPPPPIFNTNAIFNWGNYDGNNGGDDGGDGGVGVTFNSRTPRLAPELLVTNWGVVDFVPATNWGPASWSGHTLSLTPFGSGQTSVYSFSATVFSEMPAGSKANRALATVGSYQASVWSPVGAVMTLNPTWLNTVGEPEYLQLQFTNATSGNFEMDATNTASGMTITHGNFSWK